MRWTKRPDGTWRRPEHRRAGYVGELEQAEYVSPGVAMERTREAAAGRVPGMSPTDDAEGEFQATRASQKNQRKKEQRREKAEAQDAQQRAAEATATETTMPGAPAGAVAKPRAATEPPAESKAPEGSQLSEEDKRKKALQKKLKQIADIEEKERNGAQLNQDQSAKLASKQDIENELNMLINGVQSVTLENDTHDNGAAEAEAEAAMPEQQQLEEEEEAVPQEEASPPEEQQAPPQIELEGKSKKAIEKKLRQIKEIEEKEARGETLNQDQQAKLKCKEELLRALKGL